MNTLRVPFPAGYDIKLLEAVHPRCGPVRAAAATDAFKDRLLERLRRSHWLPTTARVEIDGSHVVLHDVPDRVRPAVQHRLHHFLWMSVLRLKTLAVPEEPLWEAVEADRDSFVTPRFRSLRPSRHAA